MTLNQLSGFNDAVILSQKKNFHHCPALSIWCLMMAAHQNAPESLQIAKRGWFTSNTIDAEHSLHRFHAHPTICCPVKENIITIRGWMLSLDKSFIHKTSVIVQDTGEYGHLFWPRMCEISINWTRRTLHSKKKTRSAKIFRGGTETTNSVKMWELEQPPLSLLSDNNTRRLSLFTHICAWKS